MIDAFAGSPADSEVPQHRALKLRVQQRLMESLDLLAAQRMPAAELREECLQRVERFLGEAHTPLTEAQKQALLSEVMDDIFGLGPIEVLMRDDEISDILVNGPDRVFVERAGRLEPSSARFRDEAHLLQVIQRIAGQVGRRIDESSPMLDARLPDGSRVNAIIPPLALQGPVMSVRRFACAPLEPARLVELGTWTPQMATFLEAAVRCRLNILVSGGTGSGKTTLLNVLSGWIPDAERVVTIEDAAELRLPREHVISLETRPANAEGRGEVTQRDLLRNTLRMRPDRILVGEVRGVETLDMLQAMNTGHEGSMTTVHANSSRDALRRVENMVSMAGLEYPIHVLREQLASTLDLLIHVARLTGGRRKVVSISEVRGLEGDAIVCSEIFKFHQAGVDDAGHARGQFTASGGRPHVLERMRAEGLEPPDFPAPSAAR